MSDEKTIFELLELSGVPSDKARQRAIWLTEDIEWIGFETFGIFAGHSGLEDSQGRSIPLVEYSFGKTPFSVDNASDSRDKRATSIGGSLLNKGNLIFFSIVSELGRKLLPDAWLSDDDLRHYLRTPDKHLNALNEIWWLGRFGTAVDIRPRHRMHSGPEDIDWRLRLNGTDVWINLEVKNRPLDAARHAHQKEIGPGKWLADVARKFNQSGEDEINVVGLTLFGEIDRTVQQSISSWLLKQPVVDGVLIWSHEGRNKSLFDRQLNGVKTRILNTDIVTPPREERDIIIVNEFVPDRKYWSKEMLDSFPPDL